MKILIITGGNTEEREVSILSAENISQLLDMRYDITQYVLPEDDKLLKENLHNFDIVIPIIHGANGEDGNVKSICEKNNVPCLFSSSQAHLNCFDKDLCKKLVNSIVKTPKTYTADTLEFPAIYKKIDAGSSFDISIISNKNQFKGLITKDDFIFEEFISGREFTVGVAEVNSDIISLPVVEIIKETKIFNNKQKYASNNSEYEICPANISKSLSDKLSTTSIGIFKELNLSHVSRIDYIINEKEEIYFLEVNTIPGMTNRSLLTKEIENSDYSFGELFDYWIKKELR